MSSNALNLVVKFAAIDKLTGGLKNIMKAGKGGSESVRDLQREIRAMEKDLARVNRQMAKGGGAGLSMAQRHLTEAIAETNRQLERQQNRIKRLQRISATGEKMKSAGTVGFVGITLPMLALGAKAIEESRGGAAAAAQVTASLASMGTKWTDLAKLQGKATHLMRTSLFDDDDILRDVTAKLLTFGKVSGDQFYRAQQAAVDLASKGFGDLSSNSIMIGKALDNPIKGMTALQKAGLGLSDQQKDMVKSMVAANNVAGAQKLILSALERQSAGSGMAARKADPMAAARLDFGEAMQAAGDQLIPALLPLVKIVTQLLQGFNELSPGTQKSILVFAALAAVLPPLLIAFGAIATVVGTLGTVLGFVGGVIGAVVAAVGLVPIAIAAAVAAVAIAGYMIYAHWDKVKTAFAAGKAWFATLPAWMQSIGRMMMTGLLAALSPGLLVNHLLAVARSGITAFKNYFGIKSPSRLMMQMGGQMATGLGMGIDGGARKPLRAMSRLATGVAGAGALSLAGPSLAAPAPRAAAAPAAPVEIHVHQLPGENAEALARRVAELVEKKRRGGGSFGDDF